MGNLITTTSGFLLASKGHFDPWLFLITLLGLGSVIASSCVFNNYIDRESDQKMKRTQNRPLAKGLISNKRAIVFATLLGLFGGLVLTLYTNLLSVLLTSIGFLVYVVCYSLWKHHNRLATLVGSIAGAIPPVVGYTVVSGRFDTGAALFFLILVLWQMPHFYSIALYRLEDYANASIPTLPGQRGIDATKRQMVLYILAFLISTTLLLVFGYTGMSYLVVVSILGLLWLGLSIRGFKREDHSVWARSMFRISLVVIMGLSFMAALDAV